MRIHPLPLFGSAFSSGSAAWRLVPALVVGSRGVSRSFRRLGLRQDACRLGFLRALSSSASSKVPILQWIANHLNCNGTGVFRKGNNIIHLRREMVMHVFGIQSSSVPFPLDSTDTATVARVLHLRSQYLAPGENNINFDSIVRNMKNDETEEGFMRSFWFLIIATVLCPTTQNYVNWKILYGLQDISKLRTFDLAHLCIDHLNREIDNFSTNLFNRTEIQFNNSIYVGGCLPLAVIVYLDFIDFSKAPVSHQQNIDYGVPRMAHVKNEDFDYLTSVDLKTYSKKPFALGFLPLRDISTTPYGARAIVLAEEKWSKAPKTYHFEENVSPIYTDVLNAAFTSNSNPEVLEIISQVVAKHDEIWKRLHEEHMKKMLEELKARLIPVQANANVQDINAGTSNINPIVLLASTNMNNLSEAANLSNSPGHISSEPMRCSLFQDNIRVSATPNFPSSHNNLNNQVEIPNIVPRQLSVLQQVLETEKSPSPLKFGTSSGIKLGSLPANNGTVSKPLQTEHSKQDQLEQEHIKEANLTLAQLPLEALELLIVEELLSHCLIFSIR